MERNNSTIPADQGWDLGSPMQTHELGMISAED
jgi:hypothetical protein